MLVKVISDVPAEIPVTSPDVMPIVATDGELLIHDVPRVQERTLVAASHTIFTPAIGDAAPFCTVIVFVAEQPVPTM